MKLMFSTQATRPLRPVARNEDLLVEEIHDETVVFDTRSREAHCLGPLAAVVFAHCDGQTSTDELVALRPTSWASLWTQSACTMPWRSWRSGSLLADASQQDGLSRRQMIKRSAVTGGVVASAPLIASVFPPTAAAASTATCGGENPGDPTYLLPVHHRERDEQGGMLPAALYEQVRVHSGRGQREQVL